MPPAKLTYAQAAAAAPPPPPPPPKPKFFDFLKLPQELKDKIYGYYYASRTITVTYERRYEYTGRRRRRGTPELKISERPSRALLLPTKAITQSATPFRAQAPIDLTIPFDEDKGLSALQAICSDGIQYNTLRMKVRDLTLCGFDGRCSLGALGHAYNLITTHFSNLKKVSLHYSAVRQVYEDHERTSETTEWKSLDCDEFLAGKNDRDFRYPVRLLGVKDFAAMLENNGKGDVEVNLKNGINWNAKGRGHYLWQAIVYRVTSREVAVIRRYLH
ncbi:hypothetical protein LTR24_008435 [Lithohypha guttulata]|uniref:Uncharacterized protein n=1 Tax=Lithohypha guttulata TaxID=1690604 RepID=A0ABR0JZZ4_9EURO|nr:hypothetical protein LTR24_008435 [Lithohypha guttulata]